MDNQENIQEIQPKQETVEAKNKFEVESYSKRSLAKVEKMRLRGKMYKVDVPYLSHHLTKPEKPRVMYYVVAVMMFVLAAAIAAFALLFAISALPGLLSSASGVAGSSPSWDMFNFVSGISGMAIGFAIFIVFALLILLIAACAYLITTGLNCINLAKATKEEMAFGVTISSFTWGIVAAFAISVVVAFFVLFTMLENNKIFAIATSVILLIFAILLLVVLVRVIVDRVQNYKFAKTLDAETYSDVKAHFDALKRVKRKKESYDSRTTMFWR